MPDHTTLRRLVGCRSWRWMGGMRTACGLRVYAVNPSFVLGAPDGDLRARPKVTAIPHDALPDPTDPATVGCLLAIAREATGCPDLFARRWQPLGFRSYWVLDGVGGPTWVTDIKQPTEADALIAAIIAADAAESEP